MTKPIHTMQMTPYPYTLTLWEDVKAMEQHLNKLNPGREQLPLDVGGRCVLLCESRHVAIGVFNSDFGTLVHELGHACIHLFEEIGMKVSSKTDEAFCYLIGHLFTELRNALNDHAAKAMAKGRKRK